MMKNKLPVRFKTAGINDFLAEDYRLYEVWHDEMMVLCPVGSSDDLEDLHEWAAENLDRHVIVSGQLHRLVIAESDNIAMYDSEKMLKKLIKLERTLRKIGRNY